MKKHTTSIALSPVREFTGSVTLPGSKSISNRILLLAALSKGDTVISDLLSSEDTEVMMHALETLGVHCKMTENEHEYMISGCDGDFPNKSADLFLGNAGTAIRPLTAVLAILGGDFLLHGVARMHERPIGDLVDALNKVGANIIYSKTQGYPPIRVGRGNISKYDLQVKGNVSSQFLTALLMASPLMAKKQDVVINVIGELISKPYIEITLNLMKCFGVYVQREQWNRFVIEKGQKYTSPLQFRVEGDASSASYFFAAGLITGGPIRVAGIDANSIQGDIRFLDVIESMGGKVTYGDGYIQVSSEGFVNEIDADFNLIPDAAMTVAVLAVFAQKPSILRNIGSWRVKETDRIEAMTTELSKIGAKVSAGKDWIKIEPPEKILDATIDTYNDHRMAMCMSLASLSSKNKAGACIEINDPDCVAKTYPEYFTDFQKLVS